MITISSGTNLLNSKLTHLEGHQLYDSLKGATDNFSFEHILGRGGSATVYKVRLGDGLEVAIKRFHDIQPMVGAVSNLKLTKQIFDSTRWWCGLGCETAWSESEQSDSNKSPIRSRTRSEFENELDVLSKLTHTNIINVLGHCTEPEVILVYEYMPNGSLDTFLFDVTREASLDWLSRFRIIEGVAQGLLYLHTQEPCVVHRDVKPKNILLDANMNPKIGDFGTATMLSQGQEPYIHGIVGTFGYLPPEYARYGDLSAKVDVYAYGITLLELITSRRIMVNRTLLDDAFHLWETGRSLELLDPSVRKGNNEDVTAEIVRCIQIALLCVHNDPAERPGMSDVLLMLGDQKAVPAPLQQDTVRIPVFQNNGTCSSTEFTSPR